MPQPLAKAIADAKADTTCEVGNCLKQVRTWYEIPPRVHDAAKCWESALGRRPGDKTPPVGAPVFWTGGSHGFGHVAMHIGGGQVRSTDYPNAGHVGTVELDWLTTHWHLTYGGWAEGFNGVWIPELRGGGAGSGQRPVIFVAQLHYGPRDSDSVRQLQRRLNAISLTGGRELPETGDYLELTRDEVKKWQVQIDGCAPGSAGADGNLGPRQAQKLFPSGQFDVREWIVEVAFRSVRPGPIRVGPRCPSPRDASPALG